MGFSSWWTQDIPRSTVLSVVTLADQVPHQMKMKKASRPRSRRANSELKSQGKLADMGRAACGNSLPMLDFKEADINEQILLLAPIVSNCGFTLWPVTPEVPLAVVVTDFRVLGNPLCSTRSRQ